MKLHALPEGVVVNLSPTEARLLVREIGDLPARQCGNKLRDLHRVLFAHLHARNLLDQDEAEPRTRSRKEEPAPPPPLPDPPRYQGRW